MDIIMVRHGESEANVKKIFGQGDVRLSGTGKQQALKSKEYIEKLNFDKVYVSPLARAVETMNLLGLEGQVENRIREIDFGVLEGKSYDMISGEYPEETKKWAEDPIYYAVPGGETIVDAYKRVEKFLEELIQKDENALLICHDGIIKIALSWIFDNPEYFFRFKVENVSINTLTISEDYKHISKMNHIYY